LSEKETVKAQLAKKRKSARIVVAMIVEIHRGEVGGSDPGKTNIQGL